VRVRIRYFATRPGVEVLSDGGSQPATKKQKAYIQRLLRAFPDARELLEYEDYLKNQTQESASEFIRQAREDFAVPMSQRENYLDYVSHRPGVQLNGEHGLWCAGGKVRNLSQAVREVAEYTGSVWTPVVAIRREDAERLGYDNAENWRALVNASLCDIAKGYKIHPDHLRWYAAFHEKEKSVHIHMVVFSSDPKEGYLTPDGIRQVKSAFARRIFQQDLMHIYEQKTAYRNQLQQNAAEAMQELIRQMRDGSLENPQLEDQIEALARCLRTVRGKKVYGYLPPEVKLMVDGIVDVLAADERVAKAYDLWNEMRESICRTYPEHLPERLPLSKQKEFKPVRNMVIREALLLVQQEEGIAEEPQREADLRHVQHAAESGDPAAMCDLSDLLMKQRRSSEALYWLEQSARNGDPRGQYVLGTWYLKRGNVQNALRWLTAAADLGSSTAQYRLGMLYLKGEQVEKNLELAVRYLTASAECGNQYAQYTLGSLYRSGNGGSRDEALGREWLSRSAAQGNPYARHLLDHPDQNWTTVVQSVIRLLYHMSRIFEDNCKTDVMHRGLQIDRKRRHQLRERRLALGHKPDDHEDEEIGLH
ncbi:MAG: hypothetical protein EGR51_06280, partial [Oscillibacter sp.]|nr:hypothetical protein [Oscillibacter sp.]